MRKIMSLIFLAIFTSSTLFAASMKISESTSSMKNDLKAGLLTLPEIGCQAVSINSICGEFCITLCVPAGYTWAQFNQAHALVTAHFNATCVEP